MTLKECTKQELIKIIERLTYFKKEELRRELRNIEYEREIERLDKINNEAEKCEKIASEAFEKYCNLLKPYEGKPIKDIPSEVLIKAREYLNEYDKYFKKGLKIMGVQL